MQNKFETKQQLLSDRQMTATTPRIMQADEDFNIRFVNMVKKHRCLYDKKVPEYRNRDYQEKAWSVISQETRESVIHCKERWRNLRACLSRYIKQQSGNDPQHKPYYLTEHMSFLLPFLKSTRQSVDSSHNLYNVQNHLDDYKFGQASDLEMKQSLSDNDEETIDAFDPSAPITRTLETSTPVSDTNSAHTMNNFIPDVQIEMRTTPDANSEMFASSATPLVNGHRQHHSLNHFPQPKRIKLERTNGPNDKTISMDGCYMSGDNSDMDFFRSILPDISGLTPQQKRKFKIGILELIDDVLLKYPMTDNQASRGSNSSINLSNHHHTGGGGFWRK